MRASTCLWALLLLLRPAFASALPLDVIYEFDAQSVMRVCDDYSCANRGVRGRVRLSLDGDAATLEVLRFNLLPLIHEAIPDLFTVIIWSGIRPGRVVERGEELTRAFPPSSRLSCARAS